MSYQPYRSPFGDTTLTKVFVGGLAWETQTDVMRRYFEQFGEILEAVIIKDKNTGKSKGYGFVTFRRAESARRACADPNPIIDGRRANCNIASMGRTRPPTPRGRIHGGNPYQGGSVPQGASSSYRGVPVGMPPPPPPQPPPPPPPVLYPPYGYPTYSPDYGYPQSIYYPQLQQPQYFHQQLHGVSPSSTMCPPYFYGYNSDPMQAASRGSRAQAQSIQGPPYQLYYPRQMEGSFTYPPLPPPPPPPILPSQPSLSTRLSTDLPPQHTSTETEVGAVTSESPET